MMKLEPLHEGPGCRGQYLGLIRVLKGHFAAVWGKEASRPSGNHGVIQRDGRGSAPRRRRFWGGLEDHRHPAVTAGGVPGPEQGHTDRPRRRDVFRVRESISTLGHGRSEMGVQRSPAPRTGAPSSRRPRGGGGQVGTRARAADGAWDSQVLEGLSIGVRR